MMIDYIFCGDLRFLKQEKERLRSEICFVGALVPFDGARVWVGDSVERYRINELSLIKDHVFYVYDSTPQNVVKQLLDAGVDFKRIHVAEYEVSNEVMYAEAVEEAPPSSDRVLIFGAGACGEDFISRFRQHYRIVGVLDNDSGKWGKTVKDIVVSKPETIHSIEWDRLVICSQYWREIDLQLQSAFNIEPNLLEVWTVPPAANTGNSDAKADWVVKIEKILEKGEVLNGPFRGMRYPELKAFGSAIYPKLLGSYEYEIQGEVEQMCSDTYTSIVDIGCAEGYYAVGLGMRQKTAKIFAFDTDANALEACKSMGALNNVQLRTGGFCDKQRLLKLELGERALIVCDCEGYEVELFDREVAHALSAHDILIETHDFTRIDTTQKIVAAFSETHDLKIYESKDDILKAYHYSFQELEDFDLEEKFNVLAEWRESIMRWVFAHSKNR